MIDSFAENIKKIMGWCPVKDIEFRQPQKNCSPDFQSASSLGKTVNIRQFRSANVIFPTNSSLYTAFLIAGLSVLFRLPSSLGLLNYLIIVSVVYVFYFFIVSRSFQASILVNDSGVHLSSIGMKNITLNHSEISSIISNKLVEHSKKTLLMLKCIAFVIVFAIVTHMVMLGEWRTILSMIPLLPLSLFVYQKQKKDYYNLDTQLYIEYKNKRWYKLSPYYSLITDEVTASEIEDAIEHYRKTA
ncbi:DUF1673 family protein [Methanococcoides orientis]|uniref:hypothetical protein n=1 Tax=Methanococcoides orientis TaxID=2822137 RepID=UPI001E59BA3C|nr:hypothetical protein [Methanococcoides orientis]UGV41323.1 DUF1673 family protein [Methanococcoides orientis]